MNIPIKDYFILLNKYLKKHIIMVITLFLIIIINLVLQLINPQILRYFIDKVVVGEVGKSLIIIAVLFASFGVLRQILKVIAAYMSEKIGWIATNDLRRDLIEHCINLDMSFHKNHQSGEMIERVDGDVNSLFNFFSTFILELLSNVGLLIGVIVLLYREDYRVGLTLTVVAIIDVLVMKYVEKKSSRHWAKSREYSANLYGFLGEQVTSVEDIATSESKEYSMGLLYKLYKKMLPVEVKASLGHYYMWIANVIVFALGNAAALILSAFLFSKKEISFGTVYLIFHYTDLMFYPLEEIKSQLQKLQRAEASIKRVKELFNTKSSIKYGDSILNRNDSVGIEIKDVSFSYEDDEKVLSDINMKIERNTILGVLGHTGSGKTTLARLIVRLYDTSQGSVLFNGENIKNFSKESLLDSISYVTQEVQIFNASLRENLTMFNPNIDDELIMKIIDDIGMSEWLKKLPSGLDSVMDNGGTGLSAGEAQLVAFIRVFLKNPKVVILDEATSKLDPITERLVDNALNKLLVDRTCIIIAHRLGTVEKAHNILILEEGNIVEAGNRKALISDENSKFYDLLQKGMEEVLV